MKAFFIIAICIILIIILQQPSDAMTINSLSGNRLGNHDVEIIGNKVIQVASTIGSIISVIVIIVLGIKYMMGSVEERATYKKTLMPYLIGAAFVFGASLIASIVYNIAISL